MVFPAKNRFLSFAGNKDYEPKPFPAEPQKLAFSGNQRISLNSA